MSEKLRECPFCGGTEFDTDYDGKNPDKDWVTCKTCTLCGNWGWKNGDIAWNHRPTEDALKADYDRLVDLLQKRFPQNPDGSLPDCRVEDLFEENVRLQKAKGE